MVGARAEQPGGSSEPSEQSASPSQYKLCNQTFWCVRPRAFRTRFGVSERAAALTVCRQSALAAQRKEPGAQAQSASSSPPGQSGAPSQRAAAGTQAPESPHASAPAPHALAFACPAAERSVTSARSTDLSDGEYSESDSLQWLVSSDPSVQSGRPSQRHAIGMHSTVPFASSPPHWNCSFVQPRTGCSSKVSPS